MKLAVALGLAKTELRGTDQRLGGARLARSPGPARELSGGHRAGPPDRPPVRGQPAWSATARRWRSSSASGTGRSRSWRRSPRRRPTRSACEPAGTSCSSAPSGARTSRTTRRDGGGPPRARRVGGRLGDLRALPPRVGLAARGPLDRDGGRAPGRRRGGRVQRDGVVLDRRDRGDPRRRPGADPRGDRRHGAGRAPGTGHARRSRLLAGGPGRARRADGRCPPRLPRGAGRPPGFGAPPPRGPARPADGGRPGHRPAGGGRGDRGLPPHPHRPPCPGVARPPRRDRRPPAARHPRAPGRSRAVDAGCERSPR